MNSNTTVHPVIYFFKNILSKFTQQPDIYPIKYYKKSERIKRIRRS